MIFTVYIGNYFPEYKDKLNNCRQRYADKLGVEYKVFDDRDWIDNLMALYPHLLDEYDAINFYKHWVMYELSLEHDNVCYMDFDCFPNTTESVFDFDLDYFWVGESHRGQMERMAKSININWPGQTNRAPIAKYWNAYALAVDQNLPIDKKVYNTGFMIGRSDVIQKLDYFNSFDDSIQLMTKIKNDSFYEPMVQTFNYDNETLFSHLVNKNNVPVKTFDDEWHCSTTDPAKMYHLIGRKKDFSKYENILR